ncbi:fructoselysine 6-kinase [Sporosalibacterium faouarense]|uniref:fructoselysine 6-kinase n=1 Tax=Sporosalibacterium faouarense TaxID=516123 RepID=UPI00192A804C|nr:fructoselysine 6-kinase [Sporosalibacterium faouarense]
MKFISIGDNCMDVYKQMGKAFPGGNSVNFSVYVKQLGECSSYLGVVGNDDYGDIMIEQIRSKKVDISHVQKVEGETAHTNVEIKNGDRILNDYDEGVLKHFNLSDEDLQYIRSHDFLHTAIWGNCERYLNYLKDYVTISFDFADRIDLVKIKEVCPNVDYAFLSYSEDNLSIRNTLEQIVSLGPKCAVATLGANGSVAYDGVSFYKEKAKRIDVVDTLGAGDSFIAAFMVGIAKGYDVRMCLQMGTRKASKTITYFGAW